MSSPAEDNPPDLPNPKTAALLAWLFPGLGHLYQGRRAKGVLFMASIVGLFVAGMAIGGGRVAYASTLPFTPVGPYVYDGWPFLCQSGIGVVAIPGWIERSRYLAGEGPLLSDTLYPPPAGELAFYVSGNLQRLRKIAVDHGADPDEAARRLIGPGAAEYLESLGLRPEEKGTAEDLLAERAAIAARFGADPLSSIDGLDNVVDHPHGSAKRRYDLGFRYEVGMVYTVIAGLLNLLVVYDAHSGPLLPDDRKDQPAEDNDETTE